MRKTAFLIIVITVLFTGSAFASTFSAQVGVNALGMTVGASATTTDRTKAGVDVAFSPISNSNEESWLYTQAYYQYDLIAHPRNELDVRIGAAYLFMEGKDKTDPDYSKISFGGLTVGSQYSFWFGSELNFGVSIGFDVPLIGFGSIEYNDREAQKEIAHPLSVWMLPVLASSIRMTCAFQY